MRSTSNSRLQGPCAHEPYAVIRGHVHWHAFGGEVQAEVFKTMAKGDCSSITFSGDTLHLVVREIDETELSKRLNNATMVEHVQRISRYGKA